MYDKTNEETKKFVPIRMAERITGLKPGTLRVYANKSQIESYRTPSGQRMFNTESLLSFTSTVDIVNGNPRKNRTNYCYTRVSSKKQMDDLSRQIKFVQRPEYSKYVLISDIGSGINFKRKGLQTILDECLSGTIGEIIIAHRDRLSRFGYDLIESIVKKAGGKITVIQNQESKSTEQELAEDLLSIIHIYSCRQMGRRNYSKNNKNTKDTNVSNITTTNDFTEVFQDE